MKKLSQATVREWIKSRTGRFNLRDMHKEFNIVGAVGLEREAHLRVIMKHLCEEGIVATTGKWDGDYRVVDNEAPEQHWQGAIERARDRQLWGKWKYDAKRLLLVYHKPKGSIYEIDLERFCTASEALHWIAHFSSKGNWPREDIGCFVQALDELLGLRENLCSLPNGSCLDVKSHLKKRTKPG